MFKRSLRGLLLVLALAPALLPLWQILHYGVDVPFWDQFDDDLAGLQVKVHDGDWSFGDLAAQHNEHRILVPRLAFLALGRITDGNMIAEMLAGWAVAVATSFLLLLLATRTGEAADASANRTHLPLFGWFLANLLIFSPAQAENWLWGIGLQNFLPVFWIALALHCATSIRREAIRLAATILVCTLATWSSGNGMLSWALAGGVLLWAPTWRGLAARWRSALVFAAAGALVAAVYFTGMNPPDHRGLHPYDSTLAAKLHYALVFAGSPFAAASTFSPVVFSTALGGVLYLTLAACVVRFLILWRQGTANDLCGRLLPWFAVAGFAVGSGLIAAWARAGIGPGQAASSRYVSFALYLPVALLQLVPALRPWRLFAPRHHDTVTPDRTGGLMAATIGTTALLLLALGALPPALNYSEATLRARRVTRAAVTLTKVLPGHPLIAAYVFPDAAVAQRQVAGLARIGHLRPQPFDSPEARGHIAAQPLPPAESCGRLESAWESAPDMIAFSGWAVLPTTGTTADLVVLCVADARGEPVCIDMAPVNLPRPDKAGELANPAFATCGWGVQVPAANLFAHGRPASVTAWALDGATGKLLPLAGTVELGR